MILQIHLHLLPLQLFLFLLTPVVDPSSFSKDSFHRILVTGGAGYIGSHIVLSLCDNGYEVIVLDDLSFGSHDAIDDRAKFILGSTLSNKDINKALKGVDCVIHLASFKAAGESMLNPLKYSKNTVQKKLCKIYSYL